MQRAMSGVRVQGRAAVFGEQLAGWLLFAGLLLWGWRVWNLCGALPAYDDVLEVLWVLRWWSDALRTGQPAWVFPLAFYPAGWHVATFAQGPVGFLAMLPFYWSGGSALAYNVITLFSFGLSYAGMRKLAQRFVDAPYAATIAALLFTFWGFRWFRIYGHLSILLATAALPWMMWAVDRWLRASEHPSSDRVVDSPPQRRRYGWLVLAGVLWAAVILSSWYFLWLGGILLGAWVLGYALAERARLRAERVRALILAALIPAGIALAISVPWLIVFLRETSAANAPFYDIAHVSLWDASLNSLPIPNIYHPFLQPVAHWLYRGPVNEPGQANLGLAATLLALFGLASARGDRRWWPIVLCGAAGLVLALGLTLKWNGETLQLGVFRPLNALIWRVGHALKPGFFVTAGPPAPFDNAVPLPALMLSTFVPFWERGRVFARYALVAAMGVFLLAAFGLTRVRAAWLRVLLGCLLVFEILPPPSNVVPFQPPTHPAFEWLQQQDLGQGAIIDLSSWQENFVFMPIGGNPLWATSYHGKPTVAGASSVWPEHVVRLDKWLQAHPHPFLEPDLAPMLRELGVRLILFHVAGGYARDMLAEARQNPALEEVRCFEPAGPVGPWPYPICVLRIK